MKIPYFRHLNKTDCDDMYSETETEEHLKGKKDLFEWIKVQKGVSNAVLEGWISETRQRPDIMFIYKNQQYVIEYQCSPIASEYIDRHELYKSSGIHDIWILGTKKYLGCNMREKFIQNKAKLFYDSDLKLFIYPTLLLDALQIKKSNLFKQIYEHKNEKFYGLEIDDFYFDKTIKHILLKDIEDSVNKHNKRLQSKIEFQLNNAKFFKAKEKQIFNKIKNSLVFNYNYYNFYSIKEKNKNLYLFANDIKRIDSLNKILQFNKNNWNISIKLNRGKYTLIAEPIVSNFYGEINFYKKSFNSMELISYCNDIDIFKNVLLKLMIDNKDKILNYENKELRILEVKN